MNQEILPFRIEVLESELVDLRRRLRQTRWPEHEPVADWSQGVPLAYLRGLCECWAVADIRYWNEPARGGHFAAFEQPELFAGEIRSFFRLVRG
jgi:hypothetical protein